MKTFADVKSVYSGVNGKCCSGKHSTTERSMKIIFNKIMKNPDHKFEDNHVFAVNGNRLLVAYFD